MLTAAILLFWVGYALLHTSLTAICAAAFRVPIKTVNIGFGPALLQRQLREFDFSLRLLPFAGYVALGDRSIPASNRTTSNLLSALPIRQRLAIALVGPLANIILGLLLIFVGITAPLVAGGVVILFLALFNLLPFPSLNGFEVLVTLIPSRQGQDWTQVVPDWVIMLSFLLGIGSQVTIFWVILTRPQLWVEIGRAIGAAMPN